MRAELDGLLCNGARRGKQFTYALLEERVTKPPTVDRDAALAELARSYFTTRGPATIDDFAWWSGLTKADARRGVEAAASHLRHESIDGKSYWAPDTEGASRIKPPLTHLLPNYDEYIVGFKDRTAYGVRLHSAGMKPRTSALSGNALVINGQIVGGWRRTLVGRSAVIDPTSLIRLSEAERRAVGVAARKFGRFLGLPAKIRWR
jgi:hypothetical protein